MNEKMIERFQEVRYHVHGAACGPHRETGLAAAARRFAALLLADPDTVAAPWVTRAGPEHLSDEEAEHFERMRALPGRLFSGVYPGGIVYADRGVSEGGDYARVAFLPYGTLELQWTRPASPLRDVVLAAAARMQAQRGEYFALSATAARGPDGRLLGCGQTVRLGAA